MKKILIGSVLVVGLATGLAYAHSNGLSNMKLSGGATHYAMMNGGHGHHATAMMSDGNYCGGADMAGNHPAFNQKYMDQTVELRRKMHDLRFQYMEARRNPNTSQEDLKKLQEEMDILHNQMTEVAGNMHAEPKSKG